MIRDIIAAHTADGCEQADVYVGKSLISAASGHKTRNREYFAKRGIRLNIVPDSTLGDRQMRFCAEVFDI
jgi:hypothetical protein